MRKALIVLLFVLPLFILGYICAQRQHDSSHAPIFATQPQPWSQVDQIHVSKAGHAFILYKYNEQWFYRLHEDQHLPEQTKLSPKVEDQLQVVLKATIHSDHFEEDESTFETLELTSKAPLITLYTQGKVVDRFYMGQSTRLDGGNEERTWVRRETGPAYRIYVHLHDLGTLFTQPSKKWRDTTIFEISPHSIQSIGIKTAVDELNLERNGNVWTLEEDQALALDQGVMQNLVRHLAFLHQDNFVDLSPNENLRDAVEGAEVQFRADNKTHRIQIGALVTDITLADALSEVEEGERLVRVDDHYAIFSQERTLAILPTRTMLRDRFILRLEETEIVSIERFANDSQETLRSEEGEWIYLIDENASPIDQAKLRLLLKQLHHFQVIRYLSPHETTQGAELSLALKVHLRDLQVLTLYLSPCRQGLCYARLDEGELFLLTQAMVKRLIQPLAPEN